MQGNHLVFGKDFRVERPAQTLEVGSRGEHQGSWEVQAAGHTQKHATAHICKVEGPRQLLATTKNCQGALWLNEPVRLGCTDCNISANWPQHFSSIGSPLASPLTIPLFPITETY